MKLQCVLRALIAGFFFTAAQAVLAGTPALTVSGGSSTVGHSGNSSTTMGWRFDVGAPITVTALGYYDEFTDGLLEGHDVGIFDSSDSLLVSASVPLGGGSDLVSLFRYVGITPYLLAPGEYTIGATIGADAADPVIYFANDVSTVSAVTIPAGSARYTESGTYTSLTYPDLPWSPANMYLGPNFQVAAVPEPTTLAFCTLGMLLVLAVAGYRRSNQLKPCAYS